MRHYLLLVLTLHFLTPWCLVAAHQDAALRDVDKSTTTQAFDGSSLFLAHIPSLDMDDSGAANFEGEPGDQIPRAKQKRDAGDRAKHSRLSVFAVAATVLGCVTLGCGGIQRFRKNTQRRRARDAWEMLPRTEESARSTFYDTTVEGPDDSPTTKSVEDAREKPESPPAVATQASAASDDSEDVVVDFRRSQRNNPSANDVRPGNPLAGLLDMDDDVDVFNTNASLPPTHRPFDAPARLPVLPPSSDTVAATSFDNPFDDIHAASLVKSDGAWSENVAETAITFQPVSSERSASIPPSIEVSRQGVRMNPPIIEESLSQASSAHSYSSSSSVPPLASTHPAALEVETAKTIEQFSSSSSEPASSGSAASSPALSLEAVALARPSSSPQEYSPLVTTQSVADSPRPASLLLEAVPESVTTSHCKASPSPYTSPILGPALLLPSALGGEDPEFDTGARTAKTTHDIVNASSAEETQMSQTVYDEAPVLSKAPGHDPHDTACVLDSPSAGTQPLILEAWDAPQSTLQTQLDAVADRLLALPNDLWSPDESSLHELYSSTHYDELPSVTQDVDASPLTQSEGSGLPSIVFASPPDSPRTRRHAVRMPDVAQNARTTIEEPMNSQDVTVQLLEPVFHASSPAIRIISPLPTPPRTPARRPLQLRNTPSAEGQPDAPAWSLRATDENATTLSLALLPRPLSPMSINTKLSSRISSRVPSPQSTYSLLPSGIENREISRTLSISPRLIPLPISRVSSRPISRTSSNLLLTAPDPETPPLPTAPLVKVTNPSPVGSPRPQRAHVAPLPDSLLQLQAQQPHIIVAQFVNQLVNVADPAWMLRVAVALVGWFAVLASGARDIERNRRRLSPPS